MIVRRPNPEEYRRINELFAICFGFPYANCPIDPDHDTDDHWAAYTDDGEMMSNFCVPAFDIRFDGNRCRMAGIGGVATLPQYRRRGGIRACFEAALPDLYEKGFDFSFLFPFSTSYYRKFGYECCVRKLHWKVDLQLLDPPGTGGTFRLAEKSCPMTDAFRAVDAHWEAKYNMMVLHKPEDYDWTEKFDPAVKQEYTYVYFSRDQIPKGYCTFKVANESDGRNLDCSRFCFADKEGFLGLMALFKSLAADYRYVKFITPDEPALAYLLPEWSLGAVQFSLAASSGMVRAVNVRSVLEKAGYRGTGRAVIAVADPQIPQNNGCFAVAFAEGRAVSVERTEEAPDASFTVSAFSAFVAGACDFAEGAQTLGGVTVHKNRAVLEQVFYRKPMMITDYF